MRILYNTLYILILSAVPLYAETIVYRLIKEASTVGFEYTLNGNPVSGHFMDYDAGITIDFQRFANSAVDVTLKTATAKAGFALATNALKSEDVLYTERYPDIRFVSKSIEPVETGFIVRGLVTIRGIARPLTLKAKLLREADTNPKERDTLLIRLSGSLNRHDFGVSGYRAIVGETLIIKIDAHIQKQ